jgi:hypothetical protein
MIAAVFQDIANDLKSATAVMGQKASYVFEKYGSWLMVPNNLFDPEKQCPARILKT